MALAPEDLEVDEGWAWVEEEVVVADVVEAEVAGEVAVRIINASYLSLSTIANMKIGRGF